MGVLPTGQVIPTQPALHIPGVQDIEGSPLEAASAKTLASNAALAETAKHMGAGQKGAGRRKKQRGGATVNLNAHLPILPEAGTVKGVSAANNHLANIDNLNAIRTGAMYDKLGSLQPYDPMAGGRRTKRKRKAKNGRSSKRTNRRRNRKSSSHRRRTRRSIF
jgi:hypothetical protein